MLIIMGFLTFMIGLVADVIAANRKLLQDTQYHVRRAEYDAIRRAEHTQAAENEEESAMAV